MSVPNDVSSAYYARWAWTCFRYQERKKLGEKRKKENLKNGNGTQDKKPRNDGVLYIIRNGKTVPAKYPKTVDCIICRFNCNSKLSNEGWHNIYKEYYSLPNYDMKIIFLQPCSWRTYQKAATHVSNSRFKEKETEKSCIFLKLEWWYKKTTLSGIFLQNVFIFNYMCWLIIGRKVRFWSFRVSW